jgi:hypothetical protein
VLFQCRRRGDEHDLVVDLHDLDHHVVDHDLDHHDDHDRAVRSTLATDRAARG